MKKLWIPMVLLLLLLAACMSVPEGETAPSSSTPSCSTPSSSSITPPSSSVVPPTSTVPTTPLDVIKDGVAHIYRGSADIILSPDWTPSKVLRDHLYWVVKAAKESILICDEPVIAYVTTDTHVYFVKESEPTNVYVTPIGDFSNHQLLPETPLPVIKDGLAFVTYDSPNVVLPPDWVPPSECLVDHLYWVVKSTKECILICDEPIYSRSYTTTDTHVYFVKESEPTKIYRAPIGDFTNHQLFYESTFGKVNYMGIVNGLEGYLQFVADEKKFYLLDMITRETTLFMEQYYIEHAYLNVIPHQEDIEIMEWIGFYGKPTEDAPRGDYFYCWKTGKVEEDTGL